MGIIGIVHPAFEIGTRVRVCGVHQKPAFDGLVVGRCDTMFVVRDPKDATEWVRTRAELSPAAQVVEERAARPPIAS